MSLYQLKSQFQDQLRPISDGLVRLGFNANQVTISSILLSAGTAFIIYTFDPKNTPKNIGDMPQTDIAICGNKNRAIWLILPISLFTRMALNAIDGMMAREHHQASKVGAILNEAGDIVSDSLLIGSLQPHLYRYHTDNTIILNRVNKLTTLTEIIAILANNLTSQRANQGPLGKSDRAFELGFIGLLNALGFPLQPIAKPVLIVNQLLLINTSINRLRFIAQYYFDKYHPAPSPVTITAESITPAPLSNATLVAGRVPINNKTNTDDNIMPNKDINAGSNSNSFEQVNLNTSHIIAGHSCFNAYDGTAIYYRYWLTMPLEKIAEASRNAHQSEANNLDAPRQVILLHRGHEHSGRLSELGERFAKEGYQVFAWDARGNGRSGGIKDHAESITELERDLNDFVKLVSSQTGIAFEDTIIVASSIGATLAAAWVHDYAPTIRGMVLGTPAISIRLYIPMAIPALKVARKLGLMSRVSSYVKAQVLTHDKQAQASYNNDPLISSSISSDFLIDTHATGQRLLDDASAITAPTFVLCAGKDYVVDKQAEREFYEQLTSPLKRWQLYPDSFHAIFHETNKVDIFADCIEFANSLFQKPVAKVNLTNAHLDSPSKDKVDRLAIKPFNPSFAITRLAMQKFGHVSDAIATGLEHGFDSGSSLDKVYANEPKGKNIFGKAVDKFYLSNIGWQGIRIRRQHLLQLAEMAISELTQKDIAKDRKIRVLDIASGNGYYVFDLLQEFESISAELRDYDSHNIQVLTDKAKKLGVSDRVTVIEKDAFDPASYTYSSATDGLFDIAIASGVFELFSDNTLVATALSGIYDSLIDNGYIIYTNQPWHPEQEFISKTLNNHRGTDWVMRCRSQAEMDQLVAQAGFTKVDMRIDRFGIFTVSVAIKMADDKTGIKQKTTNSQLDSHTAPLTDSL